MKLRNLYLALLAGFVCHGAWASNARELTLGRGDGRTLLNKGSLTYDSMYNIFYNPSYINDYKNWIIIEKGYINGNAASTTTSQNQGGFATSLYNLNVGAYMNNTDALNLGGIAAAGTAFGTRPIDVFVGGDFGVKVGASVHYAQQAAGTGSANLPGGRHIVGKIGAQYMDFDPFFHYVISSRDRSVAEDKRTGYIAGLRYHFGEWVPYAMYANTEAKQTVSSVETKDKDNWWIAGLGRSTKVGEGTRLVYSVAYTRQNTENKVGSAGGKGWNVQVPVEIGVEGDVLSWVTIRGGIGYNTISRVGDTKNNAGDNTYARIGAGFHVGKVDIDWVFGANTSGTQTGVTNSSGGAGSTNQSIDANSIGLDSQTFSRLSVSYKW